ncbi:MAG: hypothetical protein ACRD7E_16935 [Bryobacteraceae bacterium]
MRKYGLRAALYMLAVFLSGVVVGGFSHRLYTVRAVTAKPETRLSPEEWRRKYVAEMTSRLGLAPEQVSQLNLILDETKALYRSEKDRNKAETKRIHNNYLAKVRSMLSEPQRAEYELMREEREKQRRAEKEKEKHKH